MDKHKQKIGLLKKYVATRAAFKKRMVEALRGQAHAEEESSKFFKPVTEMLIGKQREISTLSADELKKIQEKDLLGQLKEQPETQADETVKKLLKQWKKKVKYKR